MIEAAEYPLFDEAAELFGAPPDDDTNDRLGSIFAMLVGENPEPPLSLLMNAGLQAAKTQGDAYSAVLEETMKTGVDLRADDYRQLQAFFHTAARYGEARMLSAIIANLFQLFATADATPSSRRN